MTDSFKNKLLDYYLSTKIKTVSNKLKPVELPVLPNLATNRSSIYAVSLSISLNYDHKKLKRL